MKTRFQKKAVPVPCSVLLLTLSFLYFLPRSWSQHGGAFQNEAAVKQALIEENWQQVYDLLQWTSDSVVEPVPCLIKGHAALALNLNNESLCLFSAVLQDSVNCSLHIKLWRQWSARVVNQFPEKGIGYYLWGDALARQAKLDSAIIMFSKAISINPRDYLSFNARGVVYAVSGQDDYAYNDFDNVLTLNTNFADGFANRGTLCITLKDGIKESVTYFDSALGINPDFSLALNGMGCYAYFVKCDFDASSLYFNSAFSSSSCNTIAFWNQSILLLAKLERFRDSLAYIVENSSAGTEIQRRAYNNLQSTDRVISRVQSNTNYISGAKTVARTILDAGQIYFTRSPAVLFSRAREISDAHFDTHISYNNNAHNNMAVMRSDMERNYKIIAQKMPGGVKMTMKPCDPEKEFINYFGLLY